MDKDELLYHSLSIIFGRKYEVYFRDREDNIIIISSDNDNYTDDETRSIFIKQKSRDVIHLDDDMMMRHQQLPPYNVLVKLSKLRMMEVKMKLTPY
ncbi:hypothetical protein OROMI_023727 [Orobanche minor]